MLSHGERIRRGVDALDAFAAIGRHRDEIARDGAVRSADPQLPGPPTPDPRPSWRRRRHRRRSAARTRSWPCRRPTRPSRRRSDRRGCRRAIGNRATRPGARGTGCRRPTSRARSSLRCRGRGRGRLGARIRSGGNAIAHMGDQHPVHAGEALPADHREEGSVRRQLGGDRLTDGCRGVPGGLGSTTTSPVEPSTTVSDCSSPAGVAGLKATIMSGSGAAAS